MKITRRQLRKLIMETLMLSEGKGEHVGTAETDKKTAKAIAKSIVAPQGPGLKKKPSFKIFPPGAETHAGYDVFIKDDGKVGGGLHGEVEYKGRKLAGELHVEIPGLSGEEGIHAAGAAELSQALNNGFEVYAKGELAAHLGTDHGKIHIGHPEVSGQVGFRGHLGHKKKEKHGPNHH